MLHHYAALPLHGRNPIRFLEPIFEYACHEGNYSLVNILAVARAQEKADR